jgi:phosphopantetheinyl transferase (holo-ACP synthase)
MTIVGVGIDTERRDALSRWDSATLGTFAGRWLTPAELVWASAQEDFAGAVVTCVCGKEAVWKAIGGRVELDAIGVADTGGPKASVRVGGLEVDVLWSAGRCDVLATAVAYR